MFARCARVAPATALMPSAPSAATFTTSCFSSWSTLMPGLSVSVRLPFAPFTATEVSATVALTPCGRSTGFLATRDMTTPASGNDAQHFAALTSSARLRIRHHTLRRRHDHGPHAAENLRQRGTTAINSQPRPAHALEPVDHRPSVVILELHTQGRLAAITGHRVVRDVALVLQYLDDGHLELRGRQRNVGLARALAVADTRQEVGNRISHAHELPLTSSPCSGPECRHASPPRAAWCAPDRTCDTPHASGR